MKEWDSIIVEWINSLSLVENIIDDLSDPLLSVALSIIFQLQYRKDIDESLVYEELKHSLKGHYTPVDWIDFNAASSGNTIHISKILSVIIAVTSLKSHCDIFKTRPTENLTPNSEKLIFNFLKKVNDNKRESKIVVDSSFIPTFTMEDSQNKSPVKQMRTRKELFPNGPKEEYFQTSPNRFSTPKFSKDVKTSILSEKNHEIKKLNRRLSNKKYMEDQYNERIEELNAINENNEKVISDNQKLILSLQNQVKRLESDVEYFVSRDENKNETVVVEVKRLEKQLETKYEREMILEETLKGSEEKLCKKTAQIGNLNKVLKEKEARIEELTKELECFQTTVKEMETENKKLLVRFRDLEQIIEDKSNTSKETNISSEYSSFSNCSLQGENMASVIDLQFNEAQAKIEELEGKERTHLAQLDEARENVLKLEKDNDDRKKEYEDRLLNLTTNLEQSVSSLNKMTAEFKEAQATNAELEVKERTLTARLDETRANMIKLESDNADLRKDYDYRLLNLNINLEKSISALNKITVDLNESQAKNVQLEVRERTMAAQFGEARANILKLKSEDADRAKEYEERIFNLTTNMEKIMSSLNKINTEFNEAQAKNVQLELNERNLAAQLDESRAHNLKLQTDNAERRKEYEDRLLNLTTNLEQSVSSLNKMTAEFKEAQATNAELEVKERTLTARLDETRANMIKLESDNADLRKDYDYRLLNLNINLEKSISALNKITVDFNESQAKNVQLEGKERSISAQLDEARANILKLQSDDTDRRKEYEDRLFNLTAKLEKSGSALSKMTCHFNKAQAQIEELEINETTLKEELEEARANMLKIQIDDADRRKDYEDRLLNLTSNMEKSVSALNKMTAEFKEAQATNVKLEVKERTLTAQLDEARANIIKLQTDEAERTKEYEDILLNLTTKMTADFKESEAKIVELEVKESKLSEQLDEARTNILKLQTDEADRTKDYEDRLLNLRTNLVKSISALNKMTAEFKEALATNVELEVKERSLSAQLDEARANILKLQTEDAYRTKEYEDRLLNLTSNMEKSVSALNRMNVEFNEAQDKIVEFEIKEKTFKEELEEARANTLKFQTDDANRRKDYEDRLLNLTANLETSISSLNKMTVELIGAQGKIVELEVKESILTAQLDEARVNMLKLQSDELESEKLKKSMKEYDVVRRKEYEDRFSKLKGEMEKSVTANLNKKTAEFDHRTAELQSKLEKAEEEIEDHKREKAQLRCGNVELGNKIFILEKELRELKEKKRKEEEPHIPYFRSKESTSSYSHDDRRMSNISLASTISNSSIGRNKPVPDGFGSYLQCEDEEEVFEFSSKNLSDLKKGPLPISTPDASERFSEYARRNSLYPSHLQSCYPSEFQFLPQDYPSEQTIRKGDPNTVVSLMKSMSGPAIGNHSSDFSAMPPPSSTSTFKAKASSFSCSNGMEKQPRKAESFFISSTPNKNLPPIPPSSREKSSGKKNESKTPSKRKILGISFGKGGD